MNYKNIYKLYIKLCKKNKYNKIADNLKDYMGKPISNVRYVTAISKLEDTNEAFNECYTKISIKIIIK